MTGRNRRRVSTLPSGGHHGFFKTLPRELRDKIYDMSYKKVFYQRSLESRPVLNFTIPYVALRHVNHQAKLEYDERVAKGEQFTALEIPLQSYFSSNLLQDCALYSHITNLTTGSFCCRGFVSHMIGPCNANEYLLEHKGWLDDVASHLPCLRRIRVAVKIPYEECLHASIESLDSITESAKVVEVTMEHAGFGDSVRWSSNMGKTPTFATWTKQHGLVWDYQAIERARESGLFGPSRML